MKRQAVILLSLLFLASCGGGADKPTAPEENLVGSWTFQDEEEGSFTFGGDGTITFKNDGTTTIEILSGTFSIKITGNWSVEGDRLTLGIFGGIYSYEITDGKLSFSTVSEGFSSLADYVFTAAGDPRTLTEVTWFDEDDDELVFNTDGTYRWGDGWEEGIWTAEGRTITVHETTTFSYVLNGNTLTLTKPDGAETVFNR